MTEANRWLLYAALFGVLVLLLRSDRLGAVVVGAGDSGDRRIRRSTCWHGCSRARPRSSSSPAGSTSRLGTSTAQAGYLLIGVWPLVALAERARQPARGGRGGGGRLRAAGARAAGTDARRGARAARLGPWCCSLSVPGRTRRAWALAAVACGVAVALGPVLEVYDSCAPGPATRTRSVIREAAARDRPRRGDRRRALGGADRRLAPAVQRTAGRRRTPALAWAPLAAAALVAAAVGLAAVERSRRDAWRTSTAPSSQLDHERLQLLPLHDRRWQPLRLLARRLEPVPRRAAARRGRRQLRPHLLPRAPHRGGHPPAAQHRAPERSRSSDSSGPPRSPFPGSGPVRLRAASARGAARASRTVASPSRPVARSSSGWCTPPSTGYT